MPKPSRASAGKSRGRGAGAEPLDAELVNTIADLAKVPKGNESARRQLYAALNQNVWIARTFTQRSRDLARSGVRLELRRVAKAAAKLADEIHSLNAGAAVSLWAGLHDSSLTLADCEWMATTLSEAAESMLSPRPRNRRPGAPSMPHDHRFFLFIHSLLRDVAEAGGHLTLDKNAGKGTLVRVLDLLRPSLPAGFIPSPLPVSRLQRIKSDWTKYAKELAEKT